MSDPTRMYLESINLVNNLVTNDFKYVFILNRYFIYFNLTRYFDNGCTYLLTGTGINKYTLFDMIDMIYKKPYTKFSFH